ncbi:MAG: DNA translocase FtsK 4TM domain-containing protein, partial [Planctomycetota bacterium]|nr:DNA translocase FtsK 4TM domain-containing protein [Planctomycetota bacterium]
MPSSRRAKSGGRASGGGGGGAGWASQPGWVVLRVAGMVLTVAVWAFAAASLIGFDPADPPSHAVWPQNHPPANWCGAFGAAVAYHLVRFLGWGAYALLAVGGILLLHTAMTRALRDALIRALGVVFVALAVAGLQKLMFPTSGPFPDMVGGLVGTAGVAELMPRFGGMFTGVILVLMLGVGLIVAMDDWLSVLFFWVRKTGVPVAVAAGSVAGRAAVATAGAAADALSSGLGSDEPAAKRRGREEETPEPRSWLSRMSFGLLGAGSAAGSGSTAGANARPGGRAGGPNARRGWTLVAADSRDPRKPGAGVGHGAAGGAGGGALSADDQARRVGILDPDKESAKLDPEALAAEEEFEEGIGTPQPAKSDAGKPASELTPKAGIPIGKVASEQEVGDADDEGYEEDEDDTPGAPQVFSEDALREKIAKLPVVFGTRNKSVATEADLKALHGAEAESANPGDGVPEGKVYQFPGLDILEEPEENFNAKL